MNIHHLKQWMEENKYDSDALLDDIGDGQTASNIFSFMKERQMNQKYLDAIYLHFANELSMELLRLYLIKNKMKLEDLSKFSDWCSTNEYDSDSLLDDLQSDCDDPLNVHNF